MVRNLESCESRDIAAAETVMIFEDGRIGKVSGLEDICGAQTVQSRTIYGRRSPPQILLVIYVIIAESVSQAKEIRKINLEIKA